MAINFPNISKPDYPLAIEFEDTSISSRFEDGTVASRTKFTRSRAKYTLTWSNLPKSEFDTLTNFVKNTICFGAKQFVWTKPKAMSANPENPDKVNVRLTAIKDAKLTQLQYYTVTLEIQEV